MKGNYYSKYLSLMDEEFRKHRLYKTSSKYNYYWENWNGQISLAQNGFKVYYVRVPSFLKEITITRASGTYTNLFEIIEDRNELNSTIITTQLPVSKWYDYLNNDTVTDAILNRVMYSSHRLKLEGESMRKLRSNIRKIK